MDGARWGFLAILISGVSFWVHVYIALQAGAIGFAIWATALVPVGMLHGLSVLLGFEWF